MRSVRLKGKSALRVLSAVASPSDLANTTVGGRDFNPDEAFAVAEELQWVPGLFRATGPAMLSLPSAERGLPTLENIVRHLRTGCDIFFLVAHGVLEGAVPKL